MLYRVSVLPLDEKGWRIHTFVLDAESLDELHKAAIRLGYLFLPGPAGEVGYPPNTIGRILVTPQPEGVVSDGALEGVVSDGTLEEVVSDGT